MAPNSGDAHLVGNCQRQGLADHVHLGHGLMDGAHTLPVPREERDGIGGDFDDLAALMHIGAATRQKVAELIAGDVACPFSRGTSPDPGFGFTFRAFVQDLAGRVRLSLQHGRDNPPIHEVRLRKRVFEVRCIHKLRIDPSEFRQACMYCEW